MVDSTSLRDDTYVLNNCTKYLARDSGAIADPWRFHIVDMYRSDVEEDGYRYNDVNFIYDGRKQAGAEVALVGTFAPCTSACRCGRG